MRKATLTSLILLTSVLPVSATELASGTVLEKLKPHRAIYDLSLEWASAQSGVESLDGRFVYEFTGGACAGYETEMRMVTDIGKEDGSVITDQTTSTLEAPSSESFSFSNVLFSNYELQTETQGEAMRTADSDLSLTIDNSGSEEQALALQNAEFPTEYMAHVIAAAQSGKRVYQANSFDGSDTSVMLALTVIGKELASEDDLSEPGAARWPITTAYYPIGDHAGDQLPDYSVSMTLSSQGVSHDILMDFGDFRIAGALQTLDFLNVSDCTN
ncbi:EipB family protein [Martelella mediterranea]|uniref:Uncharacterized protein DUF1849 n=1 Tax=Martelella mediterranea TaxID=293089 RepID=A0A4R3NTJ7_9HYPH|nr:DUF1849 family protein [Martelella mediterranea]TCT40376.1 uncharacterized protein DUF1849 [Martelella mediterranea]